MEDPNLARTDGALYTPQIGDSIKEGSGYRLEKMVIAEFGCLFRQSKISARIQRTCFTKFNSGINIKLGISANNLWVWIDSGKMLWNFFRMTLRPNGTVDRKGS